MSDRHRRGNNVANSVTSHVGGRGGGGGGGARRMVPNVPATAHVNPAQAMPPPQWPQHSQMHSPAALPYANTDFMYRFSGQGPVVTHTPSDMFPPTPYMPAGDVTMARQLQRRPMLPPPEPREKTIVNSQQFMQFPVIYNQDLKPVVSCMPQLNGAQTQTFTTANKYNDAHVLLRRVVDCPQITAAHAQQVFERLRHFRHPNLVKLNSVTQTNEFVLGSHDVVFEYRLVRNSRSLRDSMLSSSTSRRDPPRVGATEGHTWSSAVQLIGLVRAFHELGQSIRGLHFSKMLFVEETNRIMFTGLGLVDLIQGFSKGTLEEQFAEDIRSLGEVLLHLATGSVERHNYKEDGFWDRLPHCSEALKKLIEMCLGCHAAGSFQSLTIQDICTLLASRISIEVGHQQGHADYLLNECSKAQENGRMMRLMMRLDLVLASSEDLISPNSDGHDRYVLRLFHQYVFHQVDENGRARLDWGHIYHCLNKLDCGSDEIIQLVSADHDVIIVASFEDIKMILETCFTELTEASQRQGGMADILSSASSVQASASMMGSPASGHMMMMGTPSSVMTPNVLAGGIAAGTPSSLAPGVQGMRYGGMAFH